MSEFTSWESELYHHGILGMKWGIRRFQNPDGTWKAAGLKRRRLKDMSDDEIKARINRLKLEKEYRELNKGPVTRAIERFEHFQNERTKWREGKSHLIASKVSRSKLPLRNAIQSIPAELIKTITGKVNKVLDMGLDSAGRQLKEGWNDFKEDAYKHDAEKKAARAQRNAYVGLGSGESKKKKKNRKSGGIELDSSDYRVY